MKQDFQNSKLSFYYSEQKIVFDRQTKQSTKQAITIKVYADQRIVALAPLSASDEAVINAVKKRGRWIYQQLQTFQSQQKMPPRLYISGETHFYLGRRYLLKVYTTDKNHVRLYRGVLEVYTAKKERANIQKLLRQWYLARAKQIFHERLNILIAETPWVSEMPPLRLREMKTQWGNCSKKGTITLNPHLIKTDKEAIDYVILHELCHIAERNHSPRFYQLLQSVMPNWKVVKQRLDKMAGLIL